MPNVFLSLPSSLPPSPFGVESYFFFTLSLSYTHVHAHTHTHFHTLSSKTHTHTHTHRETQTHNPSAKKSIKKYIVFSLSAVGVWLSKLSEKAVECEIEFKTVRCARGAQDERMFAYLFISRLKFTCGFAWRGQLTCCGVVSSSRQKSRVEVDTMNGKGFQR